ncbi:hypothetical protein OROMI_026071 [Orobanche minor]
MCYRWSAGWEEGKKSTVSGRHVVTTVVAVARGRQVANTGRGAGGGGCRNTKVCVCSPTGHPGSFRCRHHHGEYKWVNRLVPKSQ